MTTFSCPKGHVSSEPDFCSDCGAKIAGTPDLVLGPTRSAASRAPTCPDCEAPRSGSESAYCEVCGYNFLTGAHGEIHVAGAQPSEAPRSETLPSVKKVWKISVTVDGSRREAESPEPPADFGPLEFSIQKPVTLIGRSSAARAIAPEIPLDLDDAVSHRHAILTLSDDGALVLRDIGSANGTELNGKLIEPMSDHPLLDGNEIDLGHWTRLLVRSE